MIKIRALIDTKRKPRSRRWKRVISRGCGGYRDYWGEFDCEHGYDWICEDCPCTRNAMEKESWQWKRKMEVEV